MPFPWIIIIIHSNPCQDRVIIGINWLRVQQNIWFLSISSLQDAFRRNFVESKSRPKLLALRVCAIHAYVYTYETGIFSWIRAFYFIKMAAFDASRTLCTLHTHSARTHQSCFGAPCSSIVCILLMQNNANGKLSSFGRKKRRKVDRITLPAFSVLCMTCHIQWQKGNFLIPACIGRPVGMTLSFASSHRNPCFNILEMV